MPGGDFAPTRPQPTYLDRAARTRARPKLLRPGRPPP